MIEKIKENAAVFLEKPVADKIRIVLPYMIVMLLCSRAAELYRICGGSMIQIVKNINYIYKAIPQFKITDLMIGITAGYLIIRYVKWNHRMHRKNTRKGEEYGASRWGTAEDIKPYIDSNPFNNIILSKTESLSMKARMEKFKLNRNKHVVVYGGSGSGKTYGIVKPNMMQLHSSYVVTDPKGLVFRGRKNPHKTKENLRVCRRWHYDRTSNENHRIVRAFKP